MQFKIRPFFLISPWLLLILVSPATAQEVVPQTAKEYRRAAKTDSMQQLLPLEGLIPSLQIELRYATAQNFTGKRLYPNKAKAFLRKPAALALQAVAAELADSGYHLKIWDAYRPHSVTKKMWMLIGDERYVANPAKGSNHNRGLAVDITLTQDGRDANMGTDFDHFSDTAHHAFNGLAKDVLHRRKLLRMVMERHGFAALETEWWHYSFITSTKYAVLDISFHQLRHRE